MAEDMAVMAKEKYWSLDLGKFVNINKSYNLINSLFWGCVLQGKNYIVCAVLKWPKEIF